MSTSWALCVNYVVNIWTIWTLCVDCVVNMWTIRTLCGLCGEHVNHSVKAKGKKTTKLTFFSGESNFWVLLHKHCAKYCQCYWRQTCRNNACKMLQELRMPKHTNYPSARTRQKVSNAVVKLAQVNPIQQCQLICEKCTCNLSRKCHVRVFLSTTDTHTSETTLTGVCLFTVKWITLRRGLTLQCSHKWCHFQAQ